MQYLSESKKPTRNQVLEVGIAKVRKVILIIHINKPGRVGPSSVKFSSLGLSKFSHLFVFIYELVDC